MTTGVVVLVVAVVVLVVDVDVLVVVEVPEVAVVVVVVTGDRATVKGAEPTPSFPHCETITSAAIRPSDCPSFSITWMVTVAFPPASGSKNSELAGVRPWKVKSRRASPPSEGGVQLATVAVISDPIGPAVGAIATVGGPAWPQAGAPAPNPIPTNAIKPTRPTGTLDTRVSPRPRWRTVVQAGRPHLHLERCFPTADRLAFQEILELVGTDGDGVFIVYEYELKTGARHRNTELITVRGGQLVEVQVFFGGRV